MSFTTTLPSTEIRNWYIYKIVSPSNRVYIGVTSDINKRMSIYKSKAKSRQTLVYNSIKKYGYDQHKVDIIDRFKNNFYYAADKEIFWIRSYMSNKNKFPEKNGLNLTDGGDGTIGYKHTIEQREKNRQKTLGKKASDETRRKISLANMGRKGYIRTESQKIHLKEINSKYRHTDEAKKKIGEASKGNKYALGRKMTKEQIEHRSSKIRGRKIVGEELQKHINRIQKACGKSIIQYDLKGNLIKEYPMIITAAKELGIPRLGISRNLCGNYKQSRGFVFKYK